MATLAGTPLLTPVSIVAVGGDRAFRRRLLELGFLPGVELRVLRVAPLGDPLDIEIRSCRFSIRRAEAEAIAVEAIPASVAAK